MLLQTPPFNVLSYLNILNWCTLLVYGIAITFILLGIVFSKRNIIAISIFAFCSFLLQLFLYKSFGAGFTVKVYPFITHLPLLIFCVWFYKKSSTEVLFAILTAYLFTTPRKWFGDFIAMFFNNDQSIRNIAQIIIAVPIVFAIYKYVRKPFTNFFNNVKTEVNFLVIVLAIYYMISYSTTVYTNTLYQTNIVVIGFISTCLVGVFYILLVYTINHILEKIELKNEQLILKMQIDETSVYINEVKKSQEQTAIFRHDLRHHLLLIDHYLLQEKPEKARKYIQDIVSDIDATIIKQYCENDTANLILSSYVAKAQGKGIQVNIDVVIPTILNVANIDLCTVLANGIENAMNATEKLKDKKELYISCKTNNKLYIQIQNNYDENIIFEGDVPTNPAQNHGYGTKSIVAITEKYKGVYSFEANNGIFTLRVII